MLRSRFWTSLRGLKLITRHKYDTILNQDRLLREVRDSEQEMSTAEKLATAQHQPVSTDRDKTVANLSNEHCISKNAVTGKTTERKVELGSYFKK